MFIFFFFVCDYCDKIEYNQNFFSQTNSFFTPTIFDSYNSNPAIYNMNQPYRPDWDYRLNMIHTPNFMTIIFKIIITLQRVNGDLPPPSQIFNHLIHNFHNIHSLILIHILFFVPPTREKSDLEKSIETILESQQQIQNFLNSQSFPHQTSYTPFLEHPIEEKSI